MNTSMQYSSTVPRLIVSKWTNTVQQQPTTTTTTTTYNNNLQQQQQSTIRSRTRTRTRNYWAALLKCVCNVSTCLWPYTGNLKFIFHEDWTHAIARVQCLRPAPEMTEVEACMATYFWCVLLLIIIVRLLTRQYKFNMDNHDGGWMGRFQVKAIHIKTALTNAMKPGPWFQCKA